MSESVCMTLKIFGHSVLRINGINLIKIWIPFDLDIKRCRLNFDVNRATGSAAMKHFPRFL